MKKRYSLSLKKFIKDLRALVKPYQPAMWPLAGIMVIFLALSFIVGFYAQSATSAVGMAIMMSMYGMASPAAIGLSVLEIIVAIVILLALSFFYSFFTTAVEFTYQDRLRHPEQVVSAGAVWMHFKHLRKNQLWRIILYMGLFLFLWTLPLDIISGLVAKNAILVMICRIANDLILIWKGIEYSQANFLYRDKQPQFLGQSMRHSLTASRRFMGGRKWNYILLMLVTVVVPVLIWEVIFGGLTWWGIYTATNAFIYIGLAVMILGFAFYLPVMLAVPALYYEQARATAQMNEIFAGTFKPVAELTGEAYVHDVYVPKKNHKEDKKSDPVAKGQQK
ncbi:hypothetical protein FD27_GL000682 [Limosilactobacillus frumenti DSM 13145]|uniref:Uncharacterized protein n=1 Tax=Limosilactobacillus frumenti DSM 13145 TaxID=1423746 RepID=A0A0R1PCQ9_9LACO|nr:hypothetical protein [Limosilactobacillus frumenti]KRL27938.1 hypothetical protein FD27_GL000682 [Limosilactobacillus frumenti DSM 13145]MBA2914383.1 hypothetical protein [Limosilactobacillus frumenti]QFG71961.1 hypothetical protein LF145_00540 [Limosilactobacillus frumenti]